MSSVVCSRRSRVMRQLTILLFASLSIHSLWADTYMKGQSVEPAFEGWLQNADGSYSLLFGYLNENWDEELDVPIGEDNFFTPYIGDRGQPTHFLPRRNYFSFKVQVPADWGAQELSWTLTTNGVARTAYASLSRNYALDNVVMASKTGALRLGASNLEFRSNTPPLVTLQGDAVRRVSVGQSLTLLAKVSDDGLPKAKPPASSSSANSAAAERERLLRPPSRATSGKTNALFLSWNLYRGKGGVTFDPPQIKPWEDTRTSANSPWGAFWTPPSVPADGMYSVDVNFAAPGTYILWARADDGGLYHDQYVTVHVTP